MKPLRPQDIDETALRGGYFVYIPITIMCTNLVLYGIIHIFAELKE